MNKKIQLRTINSKVFFIGFIFVAMVFGIFSYLISEYIHNTTYITGAVIGLCYLVGGIYAIIVEKSTKLITFEFTENSLNIYKEDKQKLSFPYSNIKNYNLYYVSFKKREYLIRFQADKNYFYWVCPKNFFKKQTTDDDDHIKIYKFLNLSPLYKKKIFWDKIILLWKPLFWSLLILSLLCLLTFFIWLIFFL
ncbi:hypothetical protein ETU08_02470 [Apibacter muscae]|uniref:DUF3119 family protein n=1 Tax=Apibacter muscae TaxID=2509004 RepID=UPI0011AD298F|nr:DUF3119 family protein [Apibacter muscae]TWP30887.1 hypothetical protein ETU08_02470 [Apibacter muscae]